jgi:hypothetical protein
MFRHWVSAMGITALVAGLVGSQVLPVAGKLLRIVHRRYGRGRPALSVPESHRHPLLATDAEIHLREQGDCRCLFCR